jgi:hypothetical protein
VSSQFGSHPRSVRRGGSPENLDVSKTFAKWARQDSNLGPTDYESAALTTELQARPAGE